MNKEKVKLSQLLEIIEDNYDHIQHPAYVKYTKEGSMSAVDPSYIYGYIVGGVRKPKLSLKKPKITNEYENVYEYGLDNEDKCLYCKTYDIQGNSYFNEYYVYLNDVIYRINIEYTDFSDFENKENYQKDIKDAKYSIFETYYFDEHHRPQKITCGYLGLGRNEEYQWLNEHVAIVKDGRHPYILIKDNEDVIMIASIEYGNVHHHKYSYQSQGYIDLQNYTVSSRHQLAHSNLNIEYCLINDMNGKPTEYYELILFNKKYFVYVNYRKPPQGFSYKKAKEVYKKELMNYIDEQIENLGFQVKIIGIQYGNYGYSIMNPFIGFDKDDNEDVQTMTNNIEYEFSCENKECISILDDYIKLKGYYQSFHKMMISVKKEIIEKYHVKVVLDEIVD